ncbi:MAG: hypothetical protein GY928_20865 [Colwellia sp.]|nr:hypothetical protein [Colwellia sp.]
MKHNYLSINLLNPHTKHCIICEGTGKSLPTECPGKPMSDHQESRVLAKDSDYTNGKWRNI